MQESFNHNPNESKQTGQRSVAEYLGLRTPPFTKQERTYIDSSTKNIRVITERSFVKNLQTGEENDEGLVDTLVLDQETNDLVYRAIYDQNIGTLPFSNVVHNTLDVLSVQNPSLVGSILAHRRQGNVLKRVLQGKGNCLDLSLAMGIIAKKWYPSTDLHIIPFNYIENADLKKNWSHDSFGFSFTEFSPDTGQNERFVCTFQGIVPESALKNMDTLEKYLSELKKQDPALNMEEGLRQFSSIAYEMPKKD